MKTTPLFSDQFDFFDICSALPLLQEAGEINREMPKTRLVRLISNKGKSIAIFLPQVTSELIHLLETYERQNIKLVDDSMDGLILGVKTKNVQAMITPWQGHPMTLWPFQRYIENVISAQKAIEALKERRASLEIVVIGGRGIDHLKALETREKQEKVIPSAVGIVIRDPDHGGIFSSAALVVIEN